MSNNNNQEVEVKLYAPDLSKIQATLEAAGAELVTARVHERNVRYENESETLNKQKIVLRLRQDNDVRLTYKAGKAVMDGIISRFEAEVTVSDFDTMDTILRLLRFEPYMTYEKYRTTYTLGNAEIVLDELPYGHFVEIEGDIKTIEAVIHKLGFSEFERLPYSYSEIFKHVQDYLELDFDDLTFDNFDGIDVPKRALKPIKSR